MRYARVHRGEDQVQERHLAHNFPHAAVYLLVMAKKSTPSLRSHFSTLSRNYLPDLGNYKWAKYLLLFWALRMSFFVISLLFPILSSFGSPPETDLYRYEIPILKIRELNFQSLLETRSPFIIDDFSVPFGRSIGQILDMELPRLLTNVKVSPTSKFTHFSSDQAWSSKLSSHRTYSLENMDVADFLDHRQDSSGNRYLYLSRYIRDPSSSVILQTLAPNFIYLPVGKGIIPEMRLWMSTQGVTATPHYDMEHNYFLQLNGSKKFILSSPIHYDVFEPYSFLHPCWRQSQHLELLNTSLIRSSSKFSEKKRSKKKDIVSEPPNSCQINEMNSSHSSVHEIILRPGQLLYIPPFHFHSVTALDEYSVSINAWVGSDYVVAAEKLRLNIPLPFHSSCALSDKLSSLGNLIKVVVARLLLPFPLEEFKINFLSRADRSSLNFPLRSHRDYCSQIFPFSECTDETVRVAGISILLCSLKND